MNNLIPNDSVWILYSSENSDPYFSKFITDKTIVPSMCILSNKEKFLIAHSLEFENIKDFDGNLTMYEGENSLLENMRNTLKKLSFPKNIFLNYSDKMDSQTDVLGYGAYRFISDNILQLYKQFGKEPPKFKSGDIFIYSLMDRKTQNDIFYLKIAAQRALEILNLSFKKMKIGMTEKQIANLIQNIYSFKPMYFKKYGIIKEKFSWEKELCPIVLVGPNIKKGGHTCSSNQVLRAGFTIYVDFGVKIYLKNGKKYSSDIQRMGYALKPNEIDAPENIKNIFKCLHDSIALGIKNAKPGVKGYEIDEIVRNNIIKNGYPNYNHATGHPVGELAHNPGTSLSPKGHKRSALDLQENGVYTIEPRIQTENGGSIEEMVLVSKNGATTMCPKQEKLYLVR